MSPTPRPERRTDPALANIQDELIAREPIFHRPEHGCARADFEQLMVADYWEVGASGRRYGHDHILDILDERYASPHEELWETSDFHCRELAADLYLLTYTLIEGRRTTRRATIWRHTELRWQIVYHQGTVVADDGE